MTLGNDVRFNDYEANLGYLISPDILAGIVYVYTHGKGDEVDTNPIYRAIDLYMDYLLSKRIDVYFATQLMKAEVSATQAQMTYVTSPSNGQSQGLARVGFRHRLQRSQEVWLG